MVNDEPDFKDLDDARLAWENICFAFGLSGPYRSHPSETELRLAEHNVLLILRSMLTSAVTLARSYMQDELVDTIFFCAQDLPKGLGSDFAATVVRDTKETAFEQPDEDRHEIYAENKNRHFFGIGDALGFLLAGLSADTFSPSLDRDEFTRLALSASADLLAGHPARDEYLDWFDAENSSIRTVLRHYPSLDFGIFFYFGSFQKWSFWRDWYERFLDGKPLDWNLQQQVALIDDTIWDAGPQAVADEIERIEAAHLASRLPLAETIAFNEDTNRFHVIPAPIAKPSLLGASLSQVEDALEDVLADPSNGLHDRSYEVRKLQRTLSKHGNDPQRIEMDFSSVHAGLTRQIVVEDLPPSEALLGLQSALQEGAQGIRGTHPDVAENRRILDTQKIAEMTAEQKTTLAQAQPLLEAITEGTLQEDFAADIPFLLEDHHRIPTPPPELGAPERNPALAGVDEARRTFGRIAQIALLLRKVPKLVHAIEGSAGYKAVAIIATLVGLGIVLI